MRSPATGLGTSWVATKTTVSAQLLMQGRELRAELRRGLEDRGRSRVTHQRKRGLSAAGTAPVRTR